MPRIKKKEFKFPDGTANFAAELTVPYTRIYNAITAVGLKKITNEEELRKVAFYLQQDAIPFEGLVKIFGPGMTLGSLLQYEETYRTQFPQRVKEEPAVEEPVVEPV